MRLQECIDLRNQFVLRHSDLNGIHEMLVPEIGEPRRLPYDVDLLGSLEAPQVFDSSGGRHGFSQSSPANRIEKAGLHEFHSGDGCFGGVETGQQALQAGTEIRDPIRLDVKSGGEQFLVPSVGQQD